MGHRHKNWSGPGFQGGRGMGPGFAPGTGMGMGPGVRRARGFGGPPPWVGEMFGPGGRGFGHRPGGPRGRRRRGDVRAAILDVLSGDQELNGYQVIQAIAERTDGVWKPSPGSVYPTIQQLEDEGLVATEESGGRKALRLTEAGTTYVAEHPEEMAAVWAPFAEDEDDDSVDLRKVIGQTMGAVWQIASTGTKAQVEEAAEVLAETRRKLYTILAEGDSE